jgi:flagellin
MAAQNLVAASRERASVQNRFAAGQTILSAEDNDEHWVTTTTQAAEARETDATNRWLQRARSINYGATAVGGSITSAQTSLDVWAEVLRTVGPSSKSAERPITLNTRLQDELEARAGKLVDADLAKESARLTALQTQQQLGVQALSIANPSSGELLSLFRRP